MDCFLGIVPPEPYMGKLRAFKKDSHSEPHITLKAPLDWMEIEQKWDAVKKVCESFPRFSVALGKPDFFGHHVLYLSVRSGEIHRLHRQLVEVLPTPSHLKGRYFELENYVPHLTLAQTSYGFSWEDLQQVERESEERLTPYPTFEASFVRIYRKDKKGDPYEPYMDVPLLNVKPE